MTLVLVVDDLCVLFVRAEVVRACAVLQLGNRIRRPHVLFATGAPSVFTASVEHVGEHWVFAEGCLVHANAFFGHFENADAFDAARCAGEILLHGFGVDTDGFKQLRTAVRHVGRHAHLGHDLRQAFADGFDVVVDRLLGRQISWQIFVQIGQCFEREVGVHVFCAVACQHSEVVHFAGAAGFDHQTSRGAQAFAHQVLVDRRQSQHCGDGHLGGAHSAVADDQDVVAAFDGVHSFSAQRRQLGFNAVVAPCQGVSHVERGALELAVCVLFDVTQLGHVGKVQHRLADFQTHGWVDLVDVEQVGLGAHE